LLFSARITEPASPSEVQPSTVLSDNAAAFAHAESIIEDLRKIGGFNDDLTIDVKNDWTKEFCRCRFYQPARE